MRPIDNETRFYHCPACDTVIGMIRDGGMPLYCCGEPLEQIPVHRAGDPGDATHVPHVTHDEYRLHVTVGDGTHPCTDDHRVSWVYLATDRGGQRKCYPCHTDGDCAPTVSFALAEETPHAVYAYCNKHGLWESGISI